MAVGITPAGSGLGPPGTALGAPSLRLHYPSEKEGPEPLWLSNSEKSKHSRKGCARWGKEERREALGSPSQSDKEVKEQKRKASTLANYSLMTQAAY